MNPFGFDFHDYQRFEWYVRGACVAAFVIAALPIVLPTKWSRIRRAELSVGALAFVLFYATAAAADGFAKIHIAYALLVCVLPALALLFAVVRRTKIAVLACVVPALLGFYATNIEPNHLHVAHKSLTAPRINSGQSVKVAVVSDIQSPRVTKYEMNAVKKVNEQKPDLILYAGDFYSGENRPFPQHFNDFVQLASGFDATYGTFFVNGDHDGPELSQVLTAAHKPLLDNEVAVVDVRGIAVGVLGVSNGMTNAGGDAINAFAKRKDLQYKIVLAHHPDAIFAVPAGIDLAASGHTHGGQVRIPFFGPVMTLSDIPRQQAGGGVFDYSDGRHLLVTRGVGYEHGAAPKLRFNSPPEFTVLLLEGVKR